MPALHPRQKKLILILIFPVFLLLYTGLVLLIWDRLPDHWLIHLVFVAIAGTIWAFPLKPVFQWVNRPVAEDDTP